MDNYLGYTTETMYRYQHSRSIRRKTPYNDSDIDEDDCICLTNMTSRRAQKLFCVTSVLLIFTLVVYIPMMASRVHTTHGWSHKSCGTKVECERKREMAKRETVRKKLMQQYDVKKFAVKENSSSDEVHLFTKKLWHFKRAEAEKVFLYQKVLSADWTMNKKNLRRMRYELHNHSKIDVADLVVSKENSDVNATLDYYIFSKALKKDDSYYHFHMYENLFEKLPPTSPFRNKLYRRCSVVGNSGILLNSDCGEDIDKSDFVFRCNIAPLKPFGRDAGVKSNLTTMNPSIFYKRFSELKSDEDIHQFLRNVSEFSGYLWLPCFSASHMNEICIKAYNNFNISRPKIVLANPDHFVKIWKFWMARNHTKLISSGFYITHVAMQLCQEVHLYGFWPFPVSVSRDKLKELPCHYFNDEPFTKSHNMDDEFRLLFQMHEHGLLRMHAGQCTASDEQLHEKEDTSQNANHFDHVPQTGGRGVEEGSR
ncbi:alpha-N-acetylneuraminate alpha-2,8-sialyltransferase ST8SIA3-like [Diadema setosum]|uniref:alpha-N-acetylneuraminate alpha-2,8-sialyltransferase ST8SIA3-like n=1 Tax=Diadema setosum TaxID=31175 RepID=UPI003B3B270A